MQLIAPDFDHTSKTPLYLQLYTYIRESITEEHMYPGEKLPSLRTLSKQLAVSLTTVDLAYRQLLMEGYVTSKPQSGYYVCSLPAELRGQTGELAATRIHEQLSLDDLSYRDQSGLDSLYSDPSCFDFIKWKKCMNKILTDYADLLLMEGDPRGEAPLRYEISRYIYQARGVRCTPDQIVIGAGTQQLTGLLCVILKRMGIEYAAFEEPGFLPVREIFSDRGFKMSLVPVERDGIQIEKLPANIKSTAYVSPSNQFPTGSIMPIGRRYNLLDWASQNDSVIIEDDYNSELRYFGKAVPSLQGLDKEGRVVYLGSFSSTLFPSVKISYMVLSAPMLKQFELALGGYLQTCSKTEQLTLALYMERGLYQGNIKKLRNLYAQKIQVATSVLKSKLGSRVKVLSNTSGLHMLLDVPLRHGQTVDSLCRKGAAEKLMMAPVSTSSDGMNEMTSGVNRGLLIFYYTKVPLALMAEAIEKLARLLA